MQLQHTLIHQQAKDIYIHFITNSSNLGAGVYSEGFDSTGGTSSVEYGDVEVIINIKITSTPHSSGVTYNGSSQSFSSAILNYDETKMTVAGTTSAKDVGSYTVTLTPKTGYCWSDSSTASITVSWYITRMNIIIYGTGASKTYDGTVLEGSYSYDSIAAGASKGLITGHTLSATAPVTSSANADTYESHATNIKIVDESGTDVTSNYSITDKSYVTLTINKKTVNINYAPTRSHTVYCTDAAEAKTSLVSAKSITLSSSAWSIEGGGAITGSLYDNSDSNIGLGWTLSSDGKTLTIPSGTAAGTYYVDISIRAAATTNYNYKYDERYITVEVVSTSIGSYGSVATPSTIFKRYFPASGGTLSTSNIDTYFDIELTGMTDGNVQTITYNNGAKRSGSVSYAWSGSSVTIPSLENTKTDKSTTRTISFTYTITGEGGKSNSVTVSSIQQQINSEGEVKDGGISSYGTPSTPTASNANNAYLCGGGTPTLSSSVTNTRRFYTIFTSGATKDYPRDEAGTVTFVKTSDTNNGTGTTQQSNWSISGTTLTHRHMGTECSTDTCVIVAKNADDTSKVSGNLTLTASNYRAESNITYEASCSIGSGLSAAGGSTTVTYSAYHTANYTYQSGSTDTTKHTTTGDSASIAIQTNGNNRFSLSGSTLSHSSMTTNETTDTVVIRCTNNSDTASSKAYKDATASITNSLTWANPVISHTTPVSLAVAGQTYTMSPSITQTGTYTSGSTISNTSATYSYAVKTSVSGYSLASDKATVTVTNNNTTSARNGFVVTLTATTPSTAGSKSSTKDVTFNQAAGSKVFNTPAITKFAYDSFPASGATKTPSVTYSQVWTWNGVSGSGGTLTSGGTLAYTSSGTIPSGFSVSSNYATTGSVVWANRTTTAGSARSAKSNLAVAVTMNGKTSSAYTCTSCDQVANVLTGLALKLTPDTIKYGATSVPTATATYTSGETKDVTATYTSSDTNVAKVE